MTARTTDKDAIAQMRDANRISAEELRADISAEELQRAMEVATALGESTQPAPGGATPARRGLRARRRPLTALAGFSAASVAAAVMLLSGSPGGGGEPAFAAAAIRVAEANPRLLVTEPGWSVIDAGEFEPNEGGIIFSDGEHELSVQWSPARLYEHYLRDRADVSTPETSRLLGRTATTVHYGGADYATMLSPTPTGSVFLEVRGGIAGTKGGLESRTEYETLLHSLNPVDVDTWLEAMPPNVVRPQDRGAAVERLLRGVPLPPGFDAAVLQGEGLVSDQYQLATTIGNAVACGWVESWLAATRSGDAAGAQEAIDAMVSSRDWQLMKTLGGYPTNISFVARELEHGHLNQGIAMKVVNEDRTGYQLGPAWATALDCKSDIWRRPLEAR
jgi:hypothetical protein